MAEQADTDGRPWWSRSMDAEQFEKAAAEWRLTQAERDLLVEELIASLPEPVQLALRNTEGALAELQRQITIRARAELRERG